MAKYNIKYGCGHEGCLQLIGKNDYREWRILQAECGVCPDCWKAEQQAKRDAEDAAAAAEAKAQELPALSGSEKQIAWAETIRQKFFNAISPLAEKVLPDAIDAWTAAVDSFQRETAARWWIDNREQRPERLVIEKAKQFKANPSSPAVSESTVKDAQIEATVRPLEPRTETVAEIKPLEDRLEIHFPERHENFREIMHNNRFQWKDGCWTRNINTTTGPAHDRAAEIGNVLLRNNFIIRIYDEQIRKNAVSGTFEPECDRLIMTSANTGLEGKLLVRWWEKDQRLYDAARRLPRSKWSKPYVVVSGIYFSEIEDFAKMYNFKISPKAQELIEDARKTKESTLVAEAAKPSSSYSATPGIPTLTPQEEEADETLRDND